MALLVTLSFMVLAVATTLELHRKARAAVTTTALTRDRISLVQMTESGIQAAMAVLAKDKLDAEVDTLRDPWADPETMAEVLGELSFDNGDIQVTVSDEMSRLQVNALVEFPEGREFNEVQREFWQRFLENWIETNEIPDADPVALLNAVKDWLDSGDDDAITGLTGAESDFYQDLDPPYAPANGPMRHNGELIRIKGMTPELLWGRGDDSAGLETAITVHGIQPAEGDGFSWIGRVNINTAEMPVIAGLLPVESRDLAESIVAYRDELETEEAIDILSDPMWYQNAPGCADVQIDPELIALSSDVYRIRATASFNASRLMVTAVVQRVQERETGRWICKVLHLEAN